MQLDSPDLFFDVVEPSPDRSDPREDVLLDLGQVRRYCRQQAEQRRAWVRVAAGGRDGVGFLGPVSGFAEARRVTVYYFHASAMLRPDYLDLPGSRTRLLAGRDPIIRLFVVIASRLVSAVELPVSVLDLLVRFNSIMLMIRMAARVRLAAVRIYFFRRSRSRFCAWVGRSWMAC